MTNGKTGVILYIIIKQSEEQRYRTEEKFSVTTSKHINKYLGGKDIGRVVPQTWIEGLVA